MLNNNSSMIPGYDVDARNEQNYLYWIKLISLFCFVALCAFSILFLGYLIFAYRFKKYPFELRQHRVQRRRRSWHKETKLFSEHYISNNIKTIRPKVSVPATTSELTPLKKCSPIPVSVPIRFQDFEDYLMKYLGNHPYNNKITKQFKKLPLQENKSCSVSLLKENIEKNRYKNLTTYDDTRVVLKHHEEGDYINASYIDGYDNKKAFIATQAPLKTTLEDFWWMVWQEKVKYIVMLVELVENGTRKCEKYWPDLNQKLRYGTFLIETVSENLLADYTDRQLKVESDGETRMVFHFQYNTWPGHCVPLYPQNFTPFVKSLLAIPQNSSAIVVHCNAGCGRTGTLILCDTVLRMVAKEKTLDFVKVLRKMRTQRANLLDNVNQYVFAHFVVLECLFGVDFSIPINDSFQDEIIKVLRKTTVKPVMQKLEKVMAQFDKRQDSVNNMNEDDEGNNQDSVFSGFTRIYRPVTTEDEPIRYINAVNVDCYRCGNKFMVTQQPTPRTIEGFWELVSDFDVNTVVSLNDIEDDTDCLEFWLWSSDKIKLEILEEIEDRIYNSTKIKITNKSTQKTVNVLTMKNWKREAPCPQRVKDLIIVWKETLSHCWKSDSQIVVTCYNGVLASGVFVALAYLLEKINYEQSCDVFSAVRTVKQSRSDFLQEWGQYEFLFKAAKVYVEEFDNYENFKN